MFFLFLNSTVKLLSALRSSLICKSKCFWGKVLLVDSHFQLSTRIQGHFEHMTGQLNMMEFLTEHTVPLYMIPEQYSGTVQQLPALSWRAGCSLNHILTRRLFQELDCNQLFASLKMQIVLNRPGFQLKTRTNKTKTMKCLFVIWVN